jgi:hypothetical protein
MRVSVAVEVAGEAQADGHHVHAEGLGKGGGKYGVDDLRRRRR